MVLGEPYVGLKSPFEVTSKLLHARQILLPPVLFSGPPGAFCQTIKERASLLWSVLGCECRVENTKFEVQGRDCPARPTEGVRVRENRGSQITEPQNQT